ncbi:hypothetical protein CYMTET_33386 [Cymbomonas tetramitiformis]|uniref:4-nitrophenylphosphatase n=1 Tax=Cymbomonas tetramitiformis TaxID=36881 RepID=A0AAE0KQY4_9CHLO|nr:hypothetical protein CYMTET_33386 [Cymbomonas tetramitiformis]
MLFLKSSGEETCFRRYSALDQFIATPMSSLSRSLLPLRALRPLPRLSAKSYPKSWVNPGSKSALSAACKPAVSAKKFSANALKAEPSAEAIVHPRYLDEHVPGELDSIDTFIFDCDGVLWKGGNAINGSIEALTALRRAGKQLFFVTNNSAHSRAEMVQKFSRLGLDVEKTEIIGAAYAAAAWLKARNFCEKAYVIGERGIYDELEELGIEVATRIGDADSSEMTDAEFIELEVEEGVGAIVVGGDSAFNYRKLAYASLCLQQVRLLACLQMHQLL